MSTRPVTPTLASKYLIAVRLREGRHFRAGDRPIVRRWNFTELCNSRFKHLKINSGRTGQEPATFHPARRQARLIFLNAVGNRQTWPKAKWLFLIGSANTHHPVTAVGSRDRKYLNPELPGRALETGYRFQSQRCDSAYQIAPFGARPLSKCGEAPLV